MKNLFIFLMILLTPFAANSKEKFFFQPLISIEYSAPEISGGVVNTRFEESKGFVEQIKDFENLALGANLRIHKNLGFNLNWSQVELDNTQLQGVSLSRKAKLRLDNYNFSTLGYYPIIKDNLDIFVEAGVSRIYSHMTFRDSNGVLRAEKHNENSGFYGVGFQAQFTKSDFLRISFQKYSGNLGLIGANYSTIRIGYLKAF